MDGGSRVEELATALQMRRPPAGVLLAVSGLHSLIEIDTRSNWSFATWAVSAIMIVLAWATTNWFLLICAPFMMAGAIMQSWGHASILIRDEEVSVFEGVGGVGRRRKMSLRAIQRVEYVVKRGRGGATTWIVLGAAGGELKFGRHLNDEQVRFVIAVLLDAMQLLAA